jgi:class 3 adenylate cyclase/predicted ATPase
MVILPECRWKMEFDEVLGKITALLQREGRLSYRAIKRRLGLDDAYLEDLKDELIYAKRLAADEDDRVLVWTGGGRQEGDALIEPGQLTQEPLPPQDEPPQVESASPAERRQLTVMFCDLVDSMVLAEQLDPEEFREVVRAYQHAAAEVIRRYEGHIAQYLGDGLLVYFGYPEAHEDDARRAVWAGLRTVKAMEELNDRLAQAKGVHLDVRLGVHTGQVVVGEMGGGDRHEPLAVGETPNVAARLQALAEPNTLLVSAATFRLTEGYFDSRDLGVRSLKGISQPIKVHQILHETGAFSRLDTATGLLPLVGRELELSMLADRWERSKQGTGQVVLVAGEAGIGKSRLVDTLAERVVKEGYPRIEFRCLPYYKNTALYPAIVRLERLLRFKRENRPDEKLEKLEITLKNYDLPLKEVVPLLAALLSVPVSGRYPPLKLSPQKQKQKTQEALVRWLLIEAERQPVLAVWEDLHWADPSTLELITLFLRQVPTSRHLTLLTFRPGFTPPWGTRSYLTALTLSRLMPAQVEVMVERLARGKILPPEVIRQLVAKTGGVPLFAEELTRMVLESDLLTEKEDRFDLKGPLPPLGIPMTLQDSLMARLDRLAWAKTVAQLGATLGRSFSHELLQAVSPLDEGRLRAELERLVDADLLLQHGVPPRATYTFRHALIQETAYQSLLRVTRQENHQRIAQVLIESFPETVETEPELLAHHCTEAGLYVQAAVYWLQAGQRAVEHSANLEALAHLRKGLEVVANLPDGPDRTRQELSFQVALAVPLTAVKTYAAPEVERAYSRAKELSEQLGDMRELFHVLHGMYRFYVVQGQYEAARGFVDQCLTLAQRLEDHELLMEAHRGLGLTLFCLGEFAQGWEHGDQGFALYDRERDASHRLVYGADPGANCLSLSSLNLWYLGYPDQGAQKYRGALALAEELSHPFTSAFALSWTVFFPQLRREVQATRKQAEATVALCTEQGFEFWLPWGTILLGWALASEGRIQEGIAQMNEGMKAHLAVGSKIGMPYFLTLIAEIHAQQGELDEARKALADALEIVSPRQDFHKAEVYRKRGELALMQGLAESEAERWFLEALQVARGQKAKSLELRAAMSLGRLRQSQGKKEEACKLLAGIYEWFTEGFETADLKDAKFLLEEWR